MSKNGFSLLVILPGCTWPSGSVPRPACLCPSPPLSLLISVAAQSPARPEPEPESGCGQGCYQAHSPHIVSQLLSLNKINPTCFRPQWGKITPRGSDYNCKLLALTTNKVRERLDKDFVKVCIWQQTATMSIIVWTVQNLEIFILKKCKCHRYDVPERWFEFVVQRKTIAQFSSDANSFILVKAAAGSAP